MAGTPPQDQSVSPTVGLRALQQSVTADERDAAADSLPVEMVTLLRAIDDRTENGTGKGEDLDDATAAAVFALCGQLVEYAERYERNAIRQLNKHQGYKWQEVADLHPRLDGRAAAQKRWARLCDDERRVSSGDFKRGAAVPRPKPPVVDTTTVADEG